MRRRLRIFAIFLLIGVAMNHAVAWSCALWSPVWDEPEFGEVARGEHLYGLVPAEWVADDGDELVWPRLKRVGMGGVGVDAENVLVVRCVEIGVDERFTAVAPTRTLQAVRAGWPLRAVECHMLMEVGGATAAGGPERRWVWSGGVESPAELRAPSWRGGVRCASPSRPIPLRPLWAGFAVNSAVYGAACGLVLAGARAGRGWARRRRGVCAGCAYPVEGLAVCPECGALTGHAAPRGITEPPDGPGV